MQRSITSLTLVLVTLAACGGDASDTVRALARPVTVLELEEGAPSAARLLPGVVRPYRETAIPFEVAGRVEWLIDVGEEVEGDQTARDGTMVQEGTLLARIDPAPLERALARSEQRLESARLQLEAQAVQLDAVLPAQLESARSRVAAAELNESSARDDVVALGSAVALAESTLAANRDLQPSGAVSDIAVQQSENELQAAESRLAQARTLVTTREREVEAAQAAVAEAEGAIALQRANNLAQAAVVEELEQSLQDAQSDLANCVLRAPFHGRVTQRHVGEGSYVQAGEAIVTLTMMNPIEVVFSVSAAVEEQLVVGTDALILPRGSSSAAGSGDDDSDAIRATLYQKRSVADAETRTFEVGLISPNERRANLESRIGLPRVPFVIPIFENPLQVPGVTGLFTLAEAVADVDGEAWVLRVRGLSQGGRSAESLRGVLEADRIPVRAGNRVMQIASFSLIEILDAEGLQAGDLLVPDPTPAHAEGFVVDDNRWLLRPGDVVQVSIDQAARQSGFWLPVRTIRELNGRRWVFAIDDDSVARAIAVEVHESVGERRRVSAPELAAGQRIAVEGSHFLMDGDRVTVVEARR